MQLRRPRRIFRSSLGRPARGVPRLALNIRPLHLGIGAIAIAFLGLGALVTAGPVIPMNPFAGQPAPSVRVAASAADIAVVDGSTLRLAQRVVRLLGIETPERGQTCRTSVATDHSLAGFDCGAAATAALAALVRERPVACDVRDSDSMGRPLAICDAGGTELNLALVAGGWARAGSARTLAGAKAEDLKRAELLARSEHRGLWARVTGASGDSPSATW